MTKKTKTKTSARPSTKGPSIPAFQPIDPLKKLLARVAGDVAGSLVGSPSPSISSAESIATVAVDIAEHILRKVGVSAPFAAEPSTAPKETSEAAS